jgi:hypothetical protein
MEIPVRSATPPQPGHLTPSTIPAFTIVMLVTVLPAAITPEYVQTAITPLAGEILASPIKV